jgi:hypothetical protein
MHLLTTTASISAILLQHDMLHSFDQQFCLFADSLSAMASAPETTYL